MKDDRLILLLALGVAAALFMRRTSAAQVAVQNAGVQNNGGTKNVSNALWTAVLGAAWTGLRDGSLGGGNNSPLYGVNALGQYVTSDGKPLGEDIKAALPLQTTGWMPTELDYGSTPNMIDDLFPTFSGLSWQ